MIYSHSQLETYERCPFKYRLQYIERLRTAKKSIEAFMGSMVHEALEKLYRDIRMSRRPEIEEISRFYLERWDACFNSNIFVVRSEYGPEDYRRTGLRCLQEYFHRYHPFDSGTPVWLERKVDIPLQDAGGGVIRFTGILDRLDSLEGERYEIHDYKTSSTLPTQQDLERDRQLSLYQLAVQKAFPDAREVELVWHYLVFDRELRLRREREDLGRVAAEAAETVAGIEAACEYPAVESALCEWCEFKEHCPKRKHLFMVACMPARELGTDRGIQLVNQFAEWSERKREAENNLKRLREEILDFASYQNVDNLQGDTRILRIKRDLMPKLPSAGSEERKGLERILHEEGVWEDTSVLNSRKLASLLKGEDPAGELRQQLESLIDWEEVASLRLSKSD